MDFPHLEVLVKLAEIVLAFLLSGLLCWFLYDYLSHMRVIVKELKELHDDMGEQATNIGALGAKVSTCLDQVRTLRENNEFFTKSVQWSLASGDLRLGRLEEKTHHHANSIQSLNLSFGEQELKLREHGRLISKYTT